MNKVVGIFLLSLTAGFSYANCSFKVINEGAKSFEEMGARGTIANLIVPLCSQLSDQDELTKENCASASNTLFMHPHYPSTCKNTNGQAVHLQFEKDIEGVCSSRQETIDRHVVLHYPADFSASACG